LRAGRVKPGPYTQDMPYYICPNCKERSVDSDGREGFSTQAPACRSCSFGFLFELQDDYYPAPTAGLIACDREGRILAAGRGVFELTGFRETDLIGRTVSEAFNLGGFDEGSDPVALSLEWGVRRLNEHLTMRTRAGIEKHVTADVFPALDDDGGLLVALATG
jgi:PAS domain S-box-containing protein